MGAGNWLALGGRSGLAGDWWGNGVALLVNPDGGGQEDGLGDVDVVGDDDQLALGVLVRMAMRGVATVWLRRGGGEKEGAKCDDRGLHVCGLSDCTTLMLGILGWCCEDVVKLTFVVDWLATTL